MNVKSSLVSLAALVSVFAHAADTARSIETINDGESVVTAVDHTRLVNGTTEVVANADGTASIVAPGAEKWVFTPTSGSVDRRSQYDAGYYSGANSDALLYRVTFYEDITGFSHGDTTVADVEFLRREDSGVTNLLWKSPVQFLANDLESVIKFQGNGIVQGLSPDRYASNGSTIDGIPIESDFSTMTVGTDVTYFVYAGGSFVYFELAGPIDWSSSVRVSHETGGSTKTVATTDQLPTIPVNVSAFTNDANYIAALTAMNIVTGIVPAWSRNSTKPSYSYNEIQNTPEIPVVNTGTLTIQQNGEQLVTFGANQSSNTTVNVRGVYYATCDTEANALAKVATLKNPNETFVLEEGVMVYVRFSKASGSNSSGQSVSAATLDVAHTGAKSIYSGSMGSRIGIGSSYAWAAGSIVGFI